MAVNGDPEESQWPLAGHDLANTRSQPTETRIGIQNVANLHPKWVFTTGIDVSATPTVIGNAVYFPDWSGNLYAVLERHGAAIIYFVVRRA